MSAPLQSPEPGFDIVDAQLHVGRAMTGETLEAMDALGIRSVLIDEFWGFWDSPDPTHIQPGFALPNGAWRAAWPTAEEAGLRYPDRFAYLVRIDRRDPQLESVMRLVGSTPTARAVRLQPTWTLEEAEVFKRGGYDHVLSLARETGVPVCLFIPGYAEHLAPYAERFPEVRLVIDHCGMGFPNIPPGRPEEEAQRTTDAGYLDEVLALARYPNVYLKWCHAQDRFGAATYPYESLRPLLRRTIDAFGADRLMWASDKSVMFGHTWADLLFAVREDPGLSPVEKRAILGGTARRVLNWPVPPPRPLNLENLTGAQS